ncbi:hypothetical protein ACR9YC_07065 [Parasphingorhabdus sp. DH2-15]|uniref:hypothetical protein n=1 Tax=Parasphingorhabdus sp. DH2-15 TaxID=3444112 RepID=UPI003F686171
MHFSKLTIAALMLGTVSTAAAAQSERQTYDCSKMKVVKPSKIGAGLNIAARAACSFIKCDPKAVEIAQTVIIGGAVIDGVITRANIEQAARDNQECLARASEESLKIGEPLTVVLEGGVTGTVEGSVVVGPRVELDLPLANAAVNFSETDMSTIAKWQRTREKRVPIMDAPIGGAQIGTIEKKKTKVFVMGHYGTGRALVELNGEVAGYVDQNALADYAATSRPEFVERDTSKAVFAKMTCIRSDGNFDDVEDGKENLLTYQCRDPLGNYDVFLENEFNNA